MPFSTAACATLAAGSMPKTGITFLDKELEQIAVVAGDLDDSALTVQAEPFGHGIRIDPGVLDPSVRVRRKIGKSEKISLRFGY